MRVSPYLPFGGDNCSLLKASGMTTPKKDWIWLPVSVYLIEHPNGLRAVSAARHILCAAEKLECARRNSFIRYQKNWWSGVDLQTFAWNGSEGPAGKSYDLFGDGSVKMINIPGHCDGLCDVKITNGEGRYVLLFADGGYATKSWKEMITSGVSLDKKKQRESLQWIREQSMDERCIMSLATHDVDIVPQTIEI